MVLRALLVEDNPGDADLVEEALRDVPELKVALARAGTLRDAAQALRDGFDVVLLDLSLPDSRGLETVRTLGPLAGGAAVIVLTGTNDQVLADQALRAGAQDYLVKGRFDGDTLARAIRHSVARKRAEDALRLSEARFRTIVETAQEGIWTTDAEGTTTYVNRRMAEILGVAPEEMVGKPASGFADPAFRAQAEEIMARRKAGVATVGDLAIRRRDGSTAWVLVAASPIRDAAGAVVGSLAMVNDITARREAEEAARRAYEQRLEIARLKELDEARTRLFNTASHELNTPLTPMRVQVDMLRSPMLGDLTPRQARSLDILSRNLDRMMALVQDILDVSRIHGGALKLARVPVDLAELAREAVESHADAARERGLALDLEAAGGLVVQGDPKRLSQVLYNLLGNALKFTPPGGRIRVRVRREGARACLEVEDTGIGLAPDEIPKLFQPFSQVHDTMQMTRSGTGLGLFICKGIVESHGGTVRAESPGRGKGSTFRVALPLAPAKA